MLNLAALRQAINERMRPVPEAVASDDVDGAPVAVKPTAISTRRIVAQAAAMWLATRVAYAIFTYFVVMFQHAGPAGEFLPFPPDALLASWRHWDAQWYIHIAQWGYWTDQPTAFFPLYPILIKTATFVVGQHWTLAALLVSNLGSLVAFAGVGLLAAHEDGSEAAAWRAIRVAVAYPLAFFLVAPYTEGLFLGFSALALWGARRGTWGWAALWAFLAGLTRPTGVILIPALAWEFGRQHGWWARIGAAARARWQQRAWRALPGQARALAQADAWRDAWRSLRLWWERDTPWREWSWWRAGGWWHDRRSRSLALGGLAVGAVPIAILTYMSFLELRFRHPLLWLHAQTLFWRRDSMPVISAVGGAIGQVFSMPPWTYWQARELVDLGPVLVFGLLTLLNIRKMPFAFTLFMLGLLYLAVNAPVLDSPDPDMLISAGRFLVVAAPMFVLLGRWTEHRPWLDLLLVSGGFLVQAVLAGFFLANGWLI